MKRKLTISIDAELANKVSALAENEERSLSKMIEIMLKWCFENYGKKTEEK